MNVDARYKVETNDYAVLSDKNVKKNPTTHLQHTRQYTQTTANSSK